MFDLKVIFKTLGIPLALIAVISALLLWAGLDLDQIYTVAVALGGLQLMGALLINVFKITGVVTAGTSGKWSAAWNLLTLIGVALWLKFPIFDIYAADKEIYKLAELLGVILTYVVQIVGTKQIHHFFVDGLGIRAFTFQPPKLTNTVHVTR